jgi:tRNA pseudouridine55 synthase
MNGVLNINKPAGMTSHDVVDQLRRLLHEKKVGHTGTLDPDATGVLPVCLGKATKIIQFLQDDEKGYEGTISLGIVTDTLDASGKVLSISDSTHVELDDVKSVFDSFVGEMDQIPPMVSAIKVQGKRLYSIARQGRTISRTPRKIFIYDLELLDFRRSAKPSKSLKSSESLNDFNGLNDFNDSIEHPVSSIELDFRVQCSRGTYIRALAADIGDALDCGAHLSRLVRTKSGIFELKDAIPLEEIQAAPQTAFQSMRSIDDVLSFMPRIVIAGSARRRFLNGVPVNGSEVVRYENEFQVDDPVRVHDEAGMLLGIGKATGAYSSAPEANAVSPRAVICKVVRVLK